MHYQFFVGQQFCSIQDRRPLTGYADEVLFTYSGQGGERGLHFRQRNRAGAEDLVGQDAEFHLAIMHDDDLVQIGQSPFGQIEELPDVDHRQYPAAHVDDTGHEWRRTGERSQIFQRVCLGYPAHLDGIGLKGQQELQDIETRSGVLIQFRLPCQGFGAFAEYPLFLVRRRLPPGMCSGGFEAPAKPVPVNVFWWSRWRIFRRFTHRLPLIRRGAALARPRCHYRQATQGYAPTLPSYSPWSW